MLSERIQSRVMRLFNRRYLGLKATDVAQLPNPHPGQEYMLYAHVPFCEQLCPYCSFNRYPFSTERAVPYFENLRHEMRMLAKQGYGFASLYVGGGTPTVMIDELCATIDLARELFSLKTVSTETNPNHLTPSIVDKLSSRVQRLSVGVQSFDDRLLQQMERYGKYGSGVETLERIVAVRDRFVSLNVDMIFNFPSQTEDILISDLAHVLESRASQVTFYPLMASPAVAHSLAQSVGQVDYRREERYYRLICEVLTGGKDPAFTFGSAWTFNARKNEDKGENEDKGTVPASLLPMIDEYIVDYEEYPAIGAGGLSYLDGSLYVNTFSVRDYNAAIEGDRMSIVGRTRFTKWDRMRYRFMMQLFGLRLDKRQWERDFGCSVSRGVPAEYLFFKTSGAFAWEDDEKILLSPRGRYLMVALMREFFIGVNKVRDQARANLTGEERELMFGE
ncbi:MAG: coproporphyrinogen III oxidase family protein [Coriobacteriales bacterium]|jgi:coproporphyrinogen III oxidase-like Fe-S oxidoreductase|nr:coproporphyrinogen III oxidase family protein [Coriobacteriales bacterium]